MPTPATHAPYRPRLSSVIGAAFVGSTLIAVMAPAHAAPDPATLTFARSADSVAPGTVLAHNALSVRNNSSDLALCITGLEVQGAGFEVHDFPGPEKVGPKGDLPVGTVTGQASQNVDVVATLSYAFADAENGCSGEADRSATATWSVQIVEPEPSPTPSETPTEEPSPPPTKTPSPSPTRTPSPSPTGTPTNSPTGTPTNTPSPSATATEGGTENGSGNNRSPSNSTGGGSGNNRTPSNSPDRTPRSNVSSVPTSSADIPTLPRNEADLPDLAPGSAEDLADLPLVTPTSDEDTETEIAADHSDMGPSIAPAVLLAAFLLALLLATPLAPTRRVRIGNGYQGKRRKA